MSIQENIYSQQIKRDQRIDFIKGLAIISVIILHSFNESTLLAIGSPFTLGQAVPVFMMIAGYNSTLSCLRKGVITLKAYYEKELISKALRRILVPFCFVLILQVLINYLFISRNHVMSVRELTLLFLKGGWGPGSYFVPVFLQHILIFPLILLTAIFSNARNFRVQSIAALFLLSIFFEYILIRLEISDSLYRLLIVRYIFAIVLGVYLAIFINSDLQKTLIGKTSKFRIDRENMVILTNESANSRLKFLLRSGIVILVSGSGLLYIISTEYFHLTLPFIFPAWGSQHSPGDFVQIGQFFEDPKRKW